MATLDGYAPYPIGLTASATVTAITRAHNLTTELSTYSQFYSQASTPATTKPGDIWRDTTTNKIFISVTDGTTQIWIEI